MILRIGDLCYIRISFQRILSKVLFYRSSTLLGYQMPCTVIVGGFFGDEGKGKIAAYLAMKDKPDICVRGGERTKTRHTPIHYRGQGSNQPTPSGLLLRSTRLPN